ncbi:MAG TPA: hypothetical protein PKM41_02910 [Deltaproteobacteria bacterium]|nr:hypothetical protein [Deltaproteobacteria bacterium]HOI05807.1 hypothetical protein [Deltaproteobacteria bacterium]
MVIDIKGTLKKLSPDRAAGERKERKAGLSVSLGEGEHKVAPYTREKDAVLLHGVRTMTDEELRSASLEGKPLAVCFSPRSIYADLGDFSSVSEEATQAHIRSTIDKTGLFNEPYSISYRKVYDIDNIRARFSYLAIPTSELEKICILDENEVFLDSFCPVEAFVAALVGHRTGDMCVVLFEDDQYVRIIGTKAGIIYHLIAIGKMNAFDLTAETLAGVSEMTSLMRNTYAETPKAVYIVGTGEISAADLRDAGIDAQVFEPGEAQGTPPCTAELVGSVHCKGYDFVPRAYRDTRNFSCLAGYSLGISAVMTLLSVVLLLLGYGNYSQAREYENRAQAARLEYLRDMGALEGQYAHVLKQLDPSRINGLISLYRDFQSEPKLYAMLGTITRAVPADMAIRRVEVLRSGLEENPQGENGESGQALPPTGSPIFRIKIEGTISAQYPQSKILFSTFLTGVQEHYPVLGASFSHSKDQASYKVECEAKQ